MRPSEAARRLAVRAADYAWILRAQAEAVRLGDDPGLADGPGVPVLLLPGVYETWGVMAPLARALHDAGHPVHAVPALRHNAAGLAESAQAVVTRVHRLDLPRIVLVAHSKGGLIGKLVLGDPTVVGRVAGLVTVATPFGGSALARLVPTRAVRGLHPSDRAIRALAADRAGHARIASLYPRFDPHVPEGSWLDGAVNVVLPVDGHFRTLGDPRVHAAVLAQLARLADAP